MTNQHNNGWTEKRRREQAERIRQSKPWEQSTGPKTTQGKARSRFNALKTGHHSVIFPNVRQLLKLNKEFLCFQATFADELYVVAALLRQKQYKKRTKGQ